MKLSRPKGRDSFCAGSPGQDTVCMGEKGVCPQSLSKIVTAAAVAAQVLKDGDDLLDFLEALIIR